jgi:hypothetical protein
MSARRKGLLNPALHHEAHGPEMRARLDATHDGAAGLAAPWLGETCSRCGYWGTPSERERGGAAKRQPCMLRCSLKRTAPPKRGPLLIPHDWVACSMFKAAP